MKARQKTEKTIQPRRPSWVRWAFWFVGGMAAAALFIMIGAGLWFQNSLNQFKSFEAETRSSYKKLNDEFPFKVPSAPSTLPTERLQAYLRARDVAMSSIPESLDALTGSYLRGGSLKRIELLRGLNASLEDLRHATRAHVAELRSEQMSLNEYLWIHGLVVHEIYRNGDPRRDQMEEIVQRLDRAFASTDWIEDGGFRAEDYAEGLDLAYQDAPPIESGAIEGMKIGNTTACVIDVLTANHTRSAREQSNSESGS